MFPVHFHNLCIYEQAWNNSVLQVKKEQKKCAAKMDTEMTYRKKSALLQSQPLADKDRL